MAKHPTCPECDQTLVNGTCGNPECSLGIEVFGSLVPGDMASIDPSEIVDYTGTLGITPTEIGSVIAHDSLNVDEDSAQTRMIDDEYYKQIQTYFPADSGSKSARGDSQLADSSGKGPGGDVSRSVNISGVRDNFSISEFIPPVRDIKFPSDTASLEDIRDLEPEDIEGDEYHIVDKLGEGGYGVVFEAEQTALNRPVAVKVLKPKKKKKGSAAPMRTGTGTGELQRRRDQFLHEAKITARLQHPNIVPLYDFGINPTGQLFYSMKKVERRPWSSVLQNAAKLLNISADEVDDETLRKAISHNIEIFLKVCDGMAYSHSMKVIHRDLKPDNIMIGDYGEVLLIDFGLSLDLSNESNQFSAGGTLVYMAPEMAIHFAKQREIQVVAHKTAEKLGGEHGSLFLDQSNLVGIGELAKRLIQQSKDSDVLEYAETILRLDAEEKELAAKIGYGSDIYLLGAILYQIAVGHPPHYFPLAGCSKGPKGAREKFQKELWLASTNGFQLYKKITDPLRLSLRNIAVRAMRTDPKDRFQSVEELQEAIRNFQLQVQSLELIETGREELEKAEGRDDYQHLLPALESFRGAGALWPEGQEAGKLQVQTAREFASRANQQKDFDAGLAILDEYVLDSEKDSEPVIQLRDKLIDGKRIRGRNRKLAAAGWVAAIALFAIAFPASVYFTAKIASQTKELAAVDTKVKNAQKTAKDDIAAAEKTAQDKIAAADKKAKDDIAAADKKAKDDIAAAEKTAQDDIAAADKKAREGIAAAVKEVTEAKAKAVEYQFDADFGEYTSRVLSLPLDFLGNKTSEARDKIQSLLDSDAKAHFKNGWLVKHFQKRAKLGSNAGEDKIEGVAAIVTPSGGGGSLIVGQQAGQPKVWRWESGAAPTPLQDLDLPNAGQITDVSVAQNGRWLALAMHDSSKALDQAGHLFVVDLEAGSTQAIQAEGVVGAQAIAFSPDGTQLVAVEELSGDYGLKQRVQIATYSFNGGQLSEQEPSTTPVRATTRSDGRVDYLATAGWKDNQPLVAVAYQTLDKEGGDRYEIVIGDGTPAEIAIPPTALHLDGQGNLYAGYKNGDIQQFNDSNLSDQPKQIGEREHGDEIVRFLSTPEGNLVSGSENGLQILWERSDLSSGLVLKERIEGLDQPLAALALGQRDKDRGLELLSGNGAGQLKLSHPETGEGKAIIKNNAVSVTCGAIDQGRKAGDVPATAFGTANGDVRYFSSDAMLGKSDGTSIEDPSVGEIDGKQAKATFHFASPFESFDVSFNDFDSMGIVGDHFVVMKDDGTLYASDLGNSTRVSRAELDPTLNPESSFVPMLASAHDKDYFFTTDPTDMRQLLRWQKSGSTFRKEQVSIASFGNDNSEIKRLKMSPDGQWLATIRTAGRYGEYLTKVYRISGNSNRLELAGESEREFRVSDPAFIDFSAGSDRMLAHSHQIGAGRSTLLSRWQLTGQRWVEVETEVLVDRKLAVVDWIGDGGAEAFVTKLGNQYSLVDQASMSETATRPVSFERPSKEAGDNLPSQKLRTVRSIGELGQYLVLTDRSLSLYEGAVDAEVTSARFEKEIVRGQDSSANGISSAKELRVFGERAVFLDDSGFHLVSVANRKLQYVSKLASRKTSVKSLSLCNEQLAILYDNGLCRVWNVAGEEPVGLGKIEQADAVKLSPDGKWVACQVDDQVVVREIKSNELAEAPAPIDLNGGVWDWAGKFDDASELLVGTADKESISWRQISPENGIEKDRTDLPQEAKGKLVDFSLAPRTERFIALKVAGQDQKLALWATGDQPHRLVEGEELKSALPNIETMTFSEIAIAGDENDPSLVGTRMVLLDNEKAPRFFLLVKDIIESAKDAENDLDNSVASSAQPRYRVQEVEGALESNDGVKLTDVQFTGDGRSLFKVSEKGTEVLLSE